MFIVHLLLHPLLQFLLVLGVFWLVIRFWFLLAGCRLLFVSCLHPSTSPPQAKSTDFFIMNGEVLSKEFLSFLIIIINLGSPNWDWYVFEVIL